MDPEADSPGIGRAPADALPAALLRHAGGSTPDHFDLLLAERPPDGEDDRACMTWRVPVDPSELPVGGTVTAVRLPAHRALYLGLRSARDLGGGRGRAEPIRRGTWLGRAGDGPCRFELRWSDGAVVVLEGDGAGPWTRVAP